MYSFFISIWFQDIFWCNKWHCVYWFIENFILISQCIISWQFKMHSYADQFVQTCESLYIMVSSNLYSVRPWFCIQCFIISALYFAWACPAFTLVLKTRGGLYVLLVSWEILENHHNCTGKEFLGYNILR